MSRQVRVYLLHPDGDTGLVGPETGHVPRSVAAAAEDEEGEVEGLYELDAGAVGLDVEVEAAQAVAAEGVGAALEDDGGGPVRGDARADDVLEEGDVHFVLDAIVQGDIEGVAGARGCRVRRPDRVEGTRAGEEVLAVVLVEGEGEDAVG